MSKPSSRGNLLPEGPPAKTRPLVVDPPAHFPDQDCGPPLRPLCPPYFLPRMTIDLPAVHVQPYHLSSRQQGYCYGKNPLPDLLT